MILHQPDREQAEHRVDRIGVAVEAADEDCIEAPRERRSASGRARRADSRPPSLPQENAPQRIGRDYGQFEDERERPVDLLTEWHPLRQHGRVKQPQHLGRPEADEWRMIEPRIDPIGADNAEFANLFAEFGEGQGIVGADGDGGQKQPEDDAGNHHNDQRAGRPREPQGVWPRIVRIQIARAVCHADRTCPNLRSAGVLAGFMGEPSGRLARSVIGHHRPVET